MVDLCWLNFGHKCTSLFSLVVQFLWLHYQASKSKSWCVLQSICSVVHIWNILDFQRNGHSAIHWYFTWPRARWTRCQWCWVGKYEVASEYWPELRHTYSQTSVIWRYFQNTNCCIPVCDVTHAHRDMLPFQFTQSPLLEYKGPQVNLPGISNTVWYGILRYWHLFRGWHLHCARAWWNVETETSLHMMDVKEYPLSQWSIQHFSWSGSYGMLLY